MVRHRRRVVWAGFSALVALSLFWACLPRSGPYRLTLTGPSVPVDYRFRLLDLSQSAFELTLGDVVSGTLTSGRETVVYRFHGTPGQQVYFDDLDLDGEALVMTLVGPDHETKFLGSSSGNSDGDRDAYRGSLPGCRGSPGSSGGGGMS